MKQYKTTKPITLACGLIGLDERQAKKRATLLKKVDEGVYEIMQKVTFKAGEIIGLEDSVADSLLHPPPIIVEASLEKIS